MTKVSTKQGALSNLAYFLLGQGKLAEARAPVEEAIRHQQAAHKANPNHADHRRYLRNHYVVLADILVRQGEHAEAVEAAGELPRIFPERSQTYCDAAHFVALCVPLAEKDARLDAGKRKELAQVYDQQVRKLLGEAGQRCGKDADAQRVLAWFLATCPVTQFRDPPRAVELAEEAADRMRKDARCWCALGVAHYRAGDWQAAVEALKKADQLRPDGGNAFDGFFLAMAHWQLGKEREARQSYDRAAQWMQKNKPGDEELCRLRAEAAELLGLAQ